MGELLNTLKNVHFFALPGFSGFSRIPDMGHIVVQVIYRYARKRDFPKNALFRAPEIPGTDLGIFPPREFRGIFGTLQKGPFFDPFFDPFLDP